MSARMDKPVFILTDEMIEQGGAVVKSVFPDRTDDECMQAAAGAFMAILSERENGDVTFAYSESGPFFSFPTSAQRLRQ